jgi:hypothetical protein
MRRFASPGLGDAILTLFWMKQHASGEVLCCDAETYRQDLFEIMDVDVVRCDSGPTLPVAGHGWPVKIEPITKTLEPPIQTGLYMTYQFNTVSVYPESPALRSFSEDDVLKIQSYYPVMKFVSLEDRSMSLHKARNLIQHSIGHIGSDSGMAWFSLLCGASVDVWYNGWADAKKFDNNWMHNYLFNEANVRFL